MLETTTEQVWTEEELEADIFRIFLTVTDSSYSASGIDRFSKIKRALDMMCNGKSVKDVWGRAIRWAYEPECVDYITKTKESCMAHFEGGPCEWATRYYAEQFCLDPNTPYVCPYKPPQIPGIPRPSPPMTTTTTTTTTTTMKPTTENQLISNMIMFVTIGGAVSILFCCAVMYILHQRREARRRRAEREAAMFGMNNWVEGIEAGITEGTKGLGTGWTTTTKSTTTGGTKTKKDKKKKGKKGSSTTSTKTDTTGTWL